jgi:membrane-associated protein
MELLSPLTDAMDALLGLITDNPWTYVVIVVLSAMDVFFPVLPAETSVVIAAVLAGTGGLSIAWVVAAAATGAFIGDNMAYWVGRLAGRPLVGRFLRDHAARVDEFAVRFRQQGGSLIIVGRFVPWGRTVVAFSAGVLHMRWRTYAAWDALAVVIWALQAAIPAYLGGLAFQDRPWLALLVGGALSLSIAALIEVIRRRRRRARIASGQDAATTAEATLTETPGGEAPPPGDPPVLGARAGALGTPAADESAPTE